MKRKLSLLQIVITVLLSSQLHAQSDDLVRYLPESAKMIIDIDAGNLSQKISWKELLEVKFFDSLMNKTDSAIRKLFSDPGETGIDFHRHFYLVINIEEDDRSMDNYVAVYGKITDENKVTRLAEKATDKNTTFKKAGENKMIIGQDVFFTWNNSVFVLHAGAKSLKETGGNKIKQTESDKKKEMARMVQKCTELLTPRTQNIYSANKYFENMTRQNADIRIWTDGSLKSTGLTRKNPFSALKTDMTAQVSHKIIVINFENGKTVGKTFTYFKDSIAGKIQSMYPENLNAELVRKIPPGNLLGLIAFSFKPGKIKDCIDNSGFKAVYEKMLEKSGLTTADIFDALKGDIMLAVNMAAQSTASAENNPLGGIQFFFAATVADEKKLNRVIDTIKHAIEARKKEKDTVAEQEGYNHEDKNPFKNLQPAMSTENGVFVLSLTENDLLAYRTGSKNGLENFVAEYGNSPLIVMFDLKTILGMAAKGMEQKSSPEDDPEMYSFFEMFDRFVVCSGKFENGAMVTTQEVKFSDPNENSLKQMIKMLDLIFSAVSRNFKAPEIKEKQN